MPNYKQQESLENERAQIDRALVRLNQLDDIEESAERDGLERYLTLAWSHLSNSHVADYNRIVEELRSAEGDEVCRFDLLGSVDAKGWNSRPRSVEDAKQQLALAVQIGRLYDAVIALRYVPSEQLPPYVRAFIRSKYYSEVQRYWLLSEFVRIALKNKPGDTELLCIYLMSIPKAFAQYAIREDLERFYSYLRDEIAETITQNHKVSLCVAAVVNRLSPLNLKFQVDSGVDLKRLLDDIVKRKVGDGHGGLGDEYARVIRVSLFDRANEFDQMVDYINEGLRVHPNSSSLYNALGFAYLTSNRGDAKGCFEQVLRIGGRNKFNNEIDRKNGYWAYIGSVFSYLDEGKIGESFSAAKGAGSLAKGHEEKVRLEGVIGEIMSVYNKKGIIKAGLPFNDWPRRALRPSAEKLPSSREAFWGKVRDAIPMPEVSASITAFSQQTLMSV